MRRASRKPARLRKKLKTSSTTVDRHKEDDLIIRTIATKLGDQINLYEETGETLATSEVVTTVVVVPTIISLTIASNPTTEATGCTTVVSTQVAASTIASSDRVSTRASARLELQADLLIPQVMVDQAKVPLKSSSTTGTNNKGVNCQPGHSKRSILRSDLGSGLPVSRSSLRMIKFEKEC